MNIAAEPHYNNEKAGRRHDVWSDDLGCEDPRVWGAMPSARQIIRTQVHGEGTPAVHYDR